MASESVENYLKAIYKLQREGEWVANRDIAERLDVSPPSVSRMVKRLSAQEYAEHHPYKGVRLTVDGRRRALRVIRNHRILETYFANVLGMSWDIVDAEVERLEHVVSDELINRMEEVLGFPVQDPHGSPIPDREGNLPKPDGSVPLDTLDAGSAVVISRIADADPAALNYLAAKGLVPGARVRLVAKEPFEGPLEVSVQEGTVHLGRELAMRIRVVHSD